MPENDKFYVERCLDGHPDDYRYLVRRYQGVLLANLAGKLGSRDRAEEAAQEALVRASNASANLSAHRSKNLAAPNSHRITHSRRQSPNCLRYTGKSYCCDITAGIPATR